MKLHSPEDIQAMFPDGSGRQVALDSRQLRELAKHLDERQPRPELRTEGGTLWVDILSPQDGSETAAA